MPPETLLRRPTNVSMKAVVHTSEPDFWQEIFGTQVLSPAHGGKSGISAEAKPVSVEIQTARTSQENYIRS
jgi:hypothetical protein